MSKRERLDRKCKSGSQPRDTVGGSAVSSSPSSLISGISYSTPLLASSVYSGSTPAPSPPWSVGQGSTFSSSTLDRIALCESDNTVVNTDTTVEYPRMSDDESAGVAVTGALAVELSPVVEAVIERLVSKINTAGPSHDRYGSDRYEEGLTRQINALAPHKDGFDISKYIRKLEADLRDIGCPTVRWKAVLFQKLQSKSASAIASTVDRDRTTYDELKALLIRSLGVSLTSLGSKLTTEFASTTRSMTPLESYVHLKNLNDSIMIQCKTMEELSLFVCCATYRASRPPVQRSLMDQWTFKSFNDLHTFALSINASEPDRPSSSNHGRQYRMNSGNHIATYECFKCHKFGHRAFECRSNMSNVSNPSAKLPSIVCFTCHEVGHKSPDCPTKRSDNSSNSSDSRSENGRKLNVKRGRTYNTSWVAVRDGSRHVEGYVNGTKCRIVPDTGAEITIVPGCLVYDDQLSDETVRVRGWDSEPVSLYTAVVDFVFNGKSFKSRVAVAHEDNLCGSVLFSIPMDTDKATQLLLDAASESDLSGKEAGHSGDTPDIQPFTYVDACSGGVSVEATENPTDPSTNQEVAEVNVVTRSMISKSNDNRKKQNTQHVVEADPVPFDDEFNKLANIDLSYSPPETSVGSNCMDSSGVELLTGADVDGDGALAGSADSEGPTGVASLSQVDKPIDVENNYPTEVDCSVGDDPIPTLDISSPMLSDSNSVDSLKSAVAADDTLHSCRELADRKENGYSYNSNGVLIHTVLVQNSPVNRVVLPASHRNKVLKLAHDGTSHVGVRGMRHIIGRTFTWPGVHSDIVAFVKSCEVCLRVNAAGNKKSKMVERRIVSVPFESVSVDLVGPLPKAKRGVKYLSLMCVWPLGGQRQCPCALPQLQRQPSASWISSVERVSHLKYCQTEGPFSWVNCCRVSVRHWVLTRLLPPHTGRSRMVS